MAVQIQNNSDGTTAGVTTQNQLKTVSENHELEFHASWFEENCYQINVVDATVTATTDQVIHIKNTSSTKRLVITEMHLQAVTDIAETAEVTEYFEIIVNDTVASGGVAGTATNLNLQSGKVAEVTITITDPTMDGVGTVIDRIYNPRAGEEITIEEHGGLILGLNDTMHIAFTSGAAAGHVKARVTFVMLENAR